LLGSSAFVIAGYMLGVTSMRVGDLAVTAPFRYTGMLWALVLGFVIWGDWPDQLTFLGAAIIIATGIFTLYRERRLAANATVSKALAQSVEPR